VIFAAANAVLPAATNTASVDTTSAYDGRFQ
jgi:hypothetical protein